MINAINDARGHKISFDELIHSFECADNAHCAPFSLVLHKKNFTFFLSFFKTEDKFDSETMWIHLKAVLAIVGQKGG